MAFLTIGAVTVPVLADSAEAIESVQVGGPPRRSFSGMLLSSVRAEKRGWRIDSAPLLDAAVAAVMAEIALYTIVSVGGDLVGGVATDCRVRVTGERFVRDLGGPPRRVLSLELLEV